MDLIATLSEKLGVPTDSAQALAGSVLGGVQDAVGGDDEDAAAQFGDAIPELDGWKGKAAGLLGGGDSEPSGGLGGLLGAAGSALGGGSGGGLGGLLGAAGESAAGIAGVVAILGKLGIDESKATLVAPLLSGAGGDDGGSSGGGIAGALGGLGGLLN